MTKLEDRIEELTEKVRTLPDKVEAQADKKVKTLIDEVEDVKGKAKTLLEKVEAQQKDWDKLKLWGSVVSVVGLLIFAVGVKEFPRMVIEYANNATKNQVDDPMK